MNIQKIFAFDSSAVRVVMVDGNPWFNANDVCSALGFANPHDALARHVDEDDLVKHEVIDARCRAQLTNHINESGLYALIFGSTKDAAKKFKRWVTSEVLPALRKTGSYAMHSAADPLAQVLPSGNPNHLVDTMVAASRVFNATLRTASAARVPLPAALRRANIAALGRTGVDMLAEIDPDGDLIDESASGAPAHNPGFAVSFADDWLAGRLPLPIGPVRSTTLYRAYLHYCRINGHAATQPDTPLNIPRFIYCITSTSRFTQKRTRYHDATTGKASIYGFIIPESTAVPNVGQASFYSRHEDTFIADLNNWSA